MILQKLKRFLFIVTLFMFSNVINAGENLSITTLNCQFFSWSGIHVKDGYSFRMKASDKKKWTNKKRTEAFNFYAEKFKNELIFLDSDIFVLTEVGTEADLRVLFDILNEQNPDYKYFFAGVSKDTYTKQNIWVISKYEIHNIKKEITGKETYLTEPDRQDEKVATISKGVCFDIVKGRYTYTIFGVHFKSEIGDYSSDLQRLAQAKIIRRHVLQAAPEKIVIVCGDLNDTEKSDVVLTIRGLFDIYFDLIQTGQYRYNKGKRETYTYQNVPAQIDHILIKDTITDIAKRGGIDTFITETALSDHNSLTVKISLK